MATTQDHRRWAEECIAMARLSVNESDKALWLTLAQSWARLAKHAAKAAINSTDLPHDATVLGAASSERD
ncbi:MAG TPA: hypothetical protein VGJ20_39125 [Xanthobacteraceae bacterium]|jgi:hypothetical protein